jgi:hypothetical protein
VDKRGLVGRELQQRLDRATGLERGALLEQRPEHHQERDDAGLEPVPADRAGDQRQRDELVDVGMPLEDPAHRADDDRRAEQHQAHRVERLVREPRPAQRVLDDQPQRDRQQRRRDGGELPPVEQLLRFVFAFAVSSEHVVSALPLDFTRGTGAGRRE